MGYEVVESLINIDQLTDAYAKGELHEVFGTGTAATISIIKELRYKDYVMEFDLHDTSVATELKKRLNDIRGSKVEDTHGWMYKV